MSEQERYGQEPYRPREPYAPYAPEQPRQGEPAQGHDPYAGVPPQQDYDPSAYYPNQDQRPYEEPDPRPYQEQGHGPAAGRHYPGNGQDPQRYPDQGQDGGRRYPDQGHDGGQRYQEPYRQPDQDAGRPPQQRYPQQPYAQPRYPAAGQPYPDQSYHQPGGYDPYPEQQGHQVPAGHQMPRQRVEELQEPSEQDYPPHEAAGHETAEHEEGDFHTEEFAFVEEEDEQAEDVIDWLKFSESRSERRDERKRRGRQRTVALVVVLALALVGGVGYLWQSGLLPGFGPSGGATVASGAQKRDVIVVNLRQVDSDDSSTALLVRNETTGKGTMVMLPNSLSVSTDDGSTTLGQSVVNQGSGPTRDGLNTLLGSDIQGTWRLDTPYLEIMVDAVGGITVNSDATVVSGGKTMVDKGSDQALNGQAAIAYAGYRAPGETEDAQLARFGQVMRALLMKMPSDTTTATKIVDDMGAIPDPSLSNDQLGVTLAGLSDLVKTGHYSTTTLPVQPNGTLSEAATSAVVKDILGGAVKNTDTSGIPTVAVEDGSANRAASGSAQVQVVNSGYTYVNGGTLSPRATSQVLYAKTSGAKTAQELAKTLGLPAREVRRGAGAANADITVLLGEDYRPPGTTPGA